MTKQTGWIGVDLDGTLAFYDGWKGKYHIGEPITNMVDIVKSLFKNGWTVKIFTARASDGDPAAIETIQDWTERHLGKRLEVTCKKDFGMIVLYDDRAIAVQSNTGILL